MYPYPTLSATYKEFYDTCPAIRPELERGMLLALSGRVREATGQEGPQKWIVKGGTTIAQHSMEYTVFVSSSAKVQEWRCNCPAAKFSDYAEDFYGYAGHICKHVAAVVLCISGNIFPQPPERVFDYVLRLTHSQFLPPVEEDWRLPGTPYKIAYKMQDGHDVIVLQTGRLRSKSLARLATNINQRGERVRMWAMEKNAESRYSEWAKEVLAEKAKKEALEEAE